MDAAGEAAGEPSVKSAAEESADEVPLAPAFEQPPAHPAADGPVQPTEQDWWRDGPDRPDST